MKPNPVLLSVLCLFLTSVAYTQTQLPYYGVDFNSSTVIRGQQTIDFVDWNGVEWIATLKGEPTFHLERAQVVRSPVIYYKTWDNSNWTASYIGVSFYNIMDGTGAQHGSPNINTWNWASEKQTVGLKDNAFLYANGTTADWIDYISWDGTGWTAALAKDGGFILAPGVNNQLEKDVDHIEYVGWDNKNWTATLTSNGFHCVQQGTNVQGDIQYLYYHTRNYILSAAKFRRVGAGGGPFGSGPGWDIAPDKDHPLPGLQPPPLPVVHRPPPPVAVVQHPTPPPPQRYRQHHIPADRVVFHAISDISLEVQIEGNSTGTRHQMHAGQDYTVLVPPGKSVAYGTWPLGQSAPDRYTVRGNPRGGSYITIP